jgi:hypothetical protein
VRAWSSGMVLCSLTGIAVRGLLARCMPYEQSLAA